MADQFKGSVQVEGLDPLVRGFGRVNKGLRRQLQKELRVIGKRVAVEAKAIAEERGLRGQEPWDPHPGQLIAKIAPSVRGGSVFIRDSARTGSYNYPARLEFQHHNPRPFLRPALDKNREEVAVQMEHLVDWIAREWGA